MSVVFVNEKNKWEKKKKARFIRDVFPRDATGTLILGIIKFQVDYC